MEEKNIRYAVEMRGISKIYPNGVAANQDISLSVRKGEIHAVMGENGAGKTTLMKMLFGLEQPTEGEIFIHGEKVNLTSPAVAIAKGVGMVHQHFMLVPSLTVAENLVLGIPPKKKGIFVDQEKAIAITEQYAEKFHLPVDPRARVADVPVGMKQKIEILKALLRGAQILILDEPTAVLTKQETEELFRQLTVLKEEGYTILFISHKLNEIMEITDRITVLRGGRLIETMNTRDVTQQEISRKMVGRDVVLKVEKSKAQPRNVVMRVRNLEFHNEFGKRVVGGVSFDVREGEILGIAGVEGNGQKELVDLLFGFSKAEAGSAEMQGTSILGISQEKLRENGVSLIPEDRMLYGIAAKGSVEENLISNRVNQKRYNRGPLFDSKKIHDLSRQLIQDYYILCKNERQEVGMLSGGNIQKVVVARELSGSPRLLIADQPTRGVDVGATAFIRKRIVDFAREGGAVLLVSADLNEVMELSDSLLVMHDGEIAGYFEDSSMLSDTLMGEYMLGIRKQGAEEIARACHE